MHEFMHAIGQMHEQQRSDRDNYIEILFSNIPSHQHHNFDKTRPTFDRTPYDVESLMQYSLSVSETYKNYNNIWLIINLRKFWNFKKFDMIFIVSSHFLPSLILSAKKNQYILSNINTKHFIFYYNESLLYTV